MSNPGDVEFCPSRKTPWSQVQYADFSSIQVSNYGEVKYFEPPTDTENEEDVEAEANGKYRGAWCVPDMGTLADMAI